MQTRANTPDFDPARVAEEYLALVPDDRQYEAELIELATVAWDGSWPGLFYQDLASLLGGLPWLADRWIDAEAIKALSSPRLPDDCFETAKDWRPPPGKWRQRSQFRQFEGLALLAALEQCTAAQAQLERALDLISQGLTSDRRGTEKRKTRRHPLKGMLFELGRPQSMAALAKALAELIPKVWVLYPRFGKFLAEAYWPLVTGRSSEWAPSPNEDDLLDLDLDEREHGDAAADIPKLESQAQALRAFTAADLVEELATQIHLSDKQKVAAAALTPAWRGEDTWNFFASIYRISLVASWLKPILQQHTDVTELKAVSQSIHSTRRLFAIRRAASWRERRGIELPKSHPPMALVAPSDRDRREGIFHLRGLLVFSRLQGFNNPDADHQLCELILGLEKGLPASPTDARVASGTWEQHPLEPILDQIGKPRSTGELHSALGALLPQIRAVHPGAGRLLAEVYLDLLADEKPQQPREKNRKSNGKTRPGIQIRRVRVPTREQVLPGEPMEEAEPGVVAYRRTGPEKKRTTIKEEIQFLRQKIWGSNPLLIRNHIESLSDPEMALLIEYIEGRIHAAIEAGQINTVRTAIVATLVALTGRGPNSFAQADSRLDDRNRNALKPRLWLGEGEFELPLLRADGAFRATKEVAHLLERTVAATRLPLPPKLCGWIDLLLAKDQELWLWTSEGLRADLNAFFADAEGEIGTGITLARARNFARARLRDVTQDTTKTMMLCGDTFGLSTASLYYVNVPVRELEASFQRAMWPIFGDPVPSQPTPDRDPVRAGSQLLVTVDAARELARGPGAPMHSSAKQRARNQARLQDHNALTDHVLCMLMAVGGHRPTAALLKLGRFDFDLNQPAAVFSDKQCDPVHSFRYVPTADLIAEQVTQYLKNLRTLAHADGVNPQAAQRAAQSLHGEAPLFFHLAPDGAPLEINMPAWRATLPGNWAVLPLNWGRTWLASRGREAGIEADHLAIALGHLEATGYPFSRESPLEPAQLSRKVSGPLGSLARSAGWVVRKGSGPDATADSLHLEVGPLRDWRREREGLERQTRQFHIELNQTRRAQFRSKREQGEKLVYSILSEAVAADIRSFDDLDKPKDPLRDSGPSPGQPGCSIQISWEELKNVERKVEEGAGSDKILAIAAHNSLHRYIKRAVDRLQWDCPIPSPWLTPSNQEPTPFFPGMFRASDQLRILREHFGRIPPRPNPAGAFTDLEWACGISAMALCLFSLEDDANRVRNILAGRMSMTGSSALGDLILLETDDRARSAGVRQIAAAALARLQRDHPSATVPEQERLDEVLAAQMPQALAGPAAGILERLCATIEVTNRVELSGLARLATDAKCGCVSMPIDRQRQFLEEGWGSVVPLLPPSARLGESSNIVGKKCKPTEARKNYNRLRKVLYIGRGPKTFKLTGERLSQANIGAYRDPLKRELKALLAEGALSKLVACIASYALHLTEHGTPGKNDAAWSTVYKYITSFGAELVAQGSDINFLELDADQYLDLYQAVIDRKTAASCKEIAARELAAFHAYLQENHGFDVVDFSDLEGVAIATGHQVDAELIQPQEVARGLAQLSALACPAAQDPTNDAVRIRLNRQTLVFTLLLRASGGRLNEIAALRFKDILANQDSTLMFVRPSRYRRLKTPAARRIIDGTKRLSRLQRKLISDWLAAEKVRLGRAWKSTLPIFGVDGDPKVRVAPEELRDRAMEALGSVLGGRSHLHRVRHLVAAEDLASLWLSDQDWRALRRSRARVRRRAVGHGCMEVALPRNVREQGFSFGHRRSSTTILNYFHMSWMTKSRAIAALHPYIARHAAAVALGISVAGADKILQRKKPSSAQDASAEPASVWVTHAAGAPTATPGNTSLQLPITVALEPGSPASAQLVSRMLRAIQRGLSPSQAALTYGLSDLQASRLAEAISEIEKKTGFKFVQRPDNGGRPRAARLFESARPIGKILDLLDNGSDKEQALVRDLAQCHLLWARRGKRDEFVWPARAIDRMVDLLHSVGIAERQIQRSNVAGETGFQKIVVLRHVGKEARMNHALAWALSVIHATLLLR